MQKQLPGDNGALTRGGFHKIRAYRLVSIHRVAVENTKAERSGRPQASTWELVEARASTRSQATRGENRTISA